MSDDLVKRLRASRCIGWPSQKDCATRAVECPCDREEEAAARIEALESALREIISPIKFMQARAKEKGHVLIGNVAYAMANDAAYLQEIARAALGDSGERRGG